jgi:hypothetical protein
MPTDQHERVLWAMQKNGMRAEARVALDGFGSRLPTLRIYATLVHRRRLEMIFERNDSGWRGFYDALAQETQAFRANGWTSASHATLIAPPPGWLAGGSPSRWFVEHPPPPAADDPPCDD